MSEPTANIEEPPCAPSSICSKVAKVMCLGFLVFVLYNGINAHEAERREDELDRQMLEIGTTKLNIRNSFFPMRMRHFPSPL